MPVRPILPNNNPSFKAIKFEDNYSRQKLVKALKKQPLNKFNECLNIIKAQEDNHIDIFIGLKSMNYQKNELNLKAKVNNSIVGSEQSLLWFLKNCAKLADNLKIQYCKSLIANEGISETTVKDCMYRNAINNLYKTDMPKTLDYIE